MNEISEIYKVIVQKIEALKAENKELKKTPSVDINQIEEMRGTIEKLKSKVTQLEDEKKKYFSQAQGIVHILEHRDTETKISPTINNEIPTPSFSNVDINKNNKIALKETLDLVKDKVPPIKEENQKKEVDIFSEDEEDPFLSDDPLDDDEFFKSIKSKP